jgi:cytochrome c-type biogenesis protein CcmH/NrfG
MSSSLKTYIAVLALTVLALLLMLLTRWPWWGLMIVPGLINFLWVDIVQANEKADAASEAEDPF